MLWKGSPFVVLCATGAATKLMQPDNLYCAKAWPPNYPATDKNMWSRTVSKESGLRNEYEHAEMRLHGLAGAQRGLLPWRHWLTVVIQRRQELTGRGISSVFASLENAMLSPFLPPGVQCKDIKETITITVMFVLPEHTPLYLPEVI